jgi:hypothetical protein
MGSEEIEQCTEASLVGPRRPQFDPNTNPDESCHHLIFVMNPDKRCQRMLKDVARYRYSHGHYNHITAHMCHNMMDLVTLPKLVAHTCFTFLIKLPVTPLIFIFFL